MELLHNPEFWVLVGFLIFFGFLARPGWKLLSGGLDSRGTQVRSQLDEAQRLRAEAQAVLDQYRAKQDEAVKTAAEILASAKDEAERMRHEGEEELRRTLAARETQALDRIALAEQVAIQQVRSKAVDIAIRAATGLVTEAIDREGASVLVDRAIDDLPRRARA